MENSKFSAKGLALVAVLLATLCSPGWSVGGFSQSGVSNPGISSRGAGAVSSRGAGALGNPVGRPTVPPSGIQSGLVRSPNPIDNSGSLGNMIITGNVEAGKHFRGVVPYGSTTDFRAPLGSASLDPFLRYSAGSQDDGAHAEEYRPFYSQTGTVSTIRPGQSAAGTSWPASTKIRTNADLQWTGQISDERILQDIPSGQTPPAGRAGDSFDDFSPRLTVPAERGPSAGVPRPVPGAKTSGRPAQYRNEMEQLQRELKRIADEAAKLRQSLSAEQTRPGDTSLPDRREMVPPTSPRQLSEQAGLEQISRPLLEQLSRQDSPAEIRAKLDRLVASVSQEQPTPAASRSLAPASPDASRGSGRSEPAGAPELSQSTVAAEEPRPVGGARESRTSTRKVGGVRPLDTTGIEQSRDREAISALPLPIVDSDKAIENRTSKIENSQPGLTALQEVNKLSAQELSTEAKRILGGHQDYDTYSASKFEQYVKAGQEYLKQGKYYRAVDAYTLASVHRPGPAGSPGERQAAALVYAGKSLALFAAGEYMSSALFLSRALQADQFSVFNFQFSISKDKLDSRIADAEECLRLCREAHRTGGVGELQFLLGYIYVRTGRLPDARRALDEACRMLPDAPAVKVLKEAIDQAKGTKN